MYRYNGGSLALKEQEDRQGRAIQSHSCNSHHIHPQRVERTSESSIQLSYSLGSIPSVTGRLYCQDVAQRATNKSHGSEMQNLSSRIGPCSARAKLHPWINDGHGATAVTYLEVRLQWTIETAYLTLPLHEHRLDYLRSSILVPDSFSSCFFVDTTVTTSSTRQQRTQVTMWESKVHMSSPVCHVTDDLCIGDYGNETGNTIAYITVPIAIWAFENDHINPDSMCWIKERSDGLGSLLFKDST
ncbi:hypothetical protein QBC36DRAFT_380972 [Triangularia setosa]|uniref:Uncharacterized protein n=1 Tax=Triangularia setosa TaxID=2587417 RepID=A0AAN6W1W0_9PEZI|nr:hypothetical protein QBC36DRAFT_380972 [Podospora setosa]